MHSEILEFQGFNIKVLVMLLALLSAQHVQRLHLLRVGCVVKVALSFKFLIVEVIKQSRPGSKFLVLEFRAYPVGRLLCLVVAVLKEFLARRKFMGIIEKRLLESYRKPDRQWQCLPSVGGLKQYFWPLG